jgi:hypothetical protein
MKMCESYLKVINATTPITNRNTTPFITLQTILGSKPDRRVRSSVYTAAKNLPVPRAGNGNSLTTGNTIRNARQNRIKNTLAYGGVCLDFNEVGEGV